MIIAVIGNDSTIANMKSDENFINKPKLPTATDTNWITPELIICSENNAQENGIDTKEMVRRNKKLKTNFLVLYNSCSLFIANTIRSKSPSGGSNKSKLFIYTNTTKGCILVHPLKFFSKVDFF
ncbi:hypothetical protein L6261_02535 [Candidatus Parcubacteria bacterium]|nr:hypothetical protein [Candidatus Parcubacteria bacterium]